MLHINVLCSNMLRGILFQWYCTLVVKLNHHCLLLFHVPYSFMSFVIHMASLVTYVLAKYSAFVVDKMIVGCHLLLQEMVPPPIMNTNLVVDLLSSRSPAQFASQYPTKPWGANPLKHNLNYKIPCKYQKMCLIAIQCSRLGLAICWLITLIGYAKSDRIHNMAYIKHPMLEILFDSNPKGWWMWFTFIKRMNNILILVVVRLGWIV